MKPEFPTKALSVAEVLTPTRLVLNGGTSDGVEWGDRFLIYSYGPMIKDPVTNEDLEQVLLRRGTGKVIWVQDKICTLESDQTVPSANPFAVALGNVPGPKLVPFDEPERGDLAHFIKPPASGT
jgi:hypothetical protein